MTVSGTGKRLSQSLTTSGPSGEAASVETDLEEIFGAPPIVPGESEANYRSLYQQLRHAVEPADPIEELWVRDVTDLYWETQRFRRLKAKLMTVAVDRAVQGEHYHPLPYGNTPTHVWARSEPAALEEVEEKLAAAGLDGVAISAQVLLTRLGDFEQLERMIMQTEARRAAALREIDRRRAAFAERLRDAIEEVAVDEALSNDT
jgi:hypothetical protein